MPKHVSLMFENTFENEERVVMDKLIQLQEKLMRKEIDDLNKLFDDTFVLIRGSGRKETKDEFLTDIQEDVLHYKESKISVPTIKITEDKATIKTMVDLRTCLLGVESIWDLNSKFELRKIDDEWYFVKWDTSYTPKNQ